MRLALLLGAVAMPALVGAQQQDSTVVLLGRVADEVDSGAVAHAMINVLGTDVVAHSDGWGYFRIGGLPLGTHTLIIRALGYGKLQQSFDITGGSTARRDFYMTRVPHLLTEMVIHGRGMRVPRGFEDVYRRGTRGLGGTFITREQIDSLNPLDLKTMLATIPGVFTNDRGVYFDRCPDSWRPQLWIDGVRVTEFKKTATPDPVANSMGTDDDPFFFNELLTQILPSQVQAIEVYPSNMTTPAEFLGYGCGTIAVWLKRGP